MDWEANERFKVLLRRVCLEHGFTSAQIDSGDITEGDAILLLQPVDAVRAWAAELFNDNEAMIKQFDAMVKSGVLKEVKNG